MFGSLAPSQICWNFIYFTWPSRKATLAPSKCRRPIALSVGSGEAGMRAGVCLNPGSPLGRVEPVLPEADLLVIMSVNPGWGGQDFIEASLGRIQQARALRDRLNPKLDIEVDGGVNASSGRESSCIAQGYRSGVHPTDEK